MRYVRLVTWACEIWELCNKAQEVHVVYVQRLTAVNQGDGLLLLVELYNSVGRCGTGDERAYYVQNKF